MQQFLLIVQLLFQLFGGILWPVCPNHNQSSVLSPACSYYFGQANLDTTSQANILLSASHLIGNTVSIIYSQIFCNHLAKEMPFFLFAQYQPPGNWGHVYFLLLWTYVKQKCCDGFCVIVSMEVVVHFWNGFQCILIILTGDIHLLSSQCIDLWVNYKSWSILPWPIYQTHINAIKQHSSNVCISISF